MSNALAISAVSAVLQYYLHNMFANLTSLFGSTPQVTVQAPDIVQTAVTSAGTSQNQVNLFLHQVTHNQAWRNVGLPSLGADGHTLLDNPPLALDLHYLLTAYGYYDWQAEGLLGYALLQLHEYPVIARSDIRTALASPSSSGLPNLAAALSTSGLADQIEMIKITPATLGREEMAWLWTALKADYRPTFPFKVSVVLMQEPASVSVPLPVMQRNIQVQQITPAQIITIELPPNQPAALPGDTISVTGQFLYGATKVALANQNLGIQVTVDLTAVPAIITNTKLRFPLPNNPTGFPAGIYSLSVQFPDPTDATRVGQVTNSLPIAIAPAFSGITGTPIVINPGALPATQVTLTSNPSVWPRQSVILALNDLSPGGQSYSAPAQPVLAVTNSLTFQFIPPVPATSLLAILQVDQVSSFVSWQSSPPKFTGPMVTV